MTAYLGSWQNRGVVQYGLDDSHLPGKIETVPLLAEFFAVADVISYRVPMREAWKVRRLPSKRS